MKPSDVHFREPAMAASGGGRKRMEINDQGRRGQGGGDGRVGEGTGTRDPPLGDLTGVYVHMLQARFTQGGRQTHGARAE